MVEHDNLDEALGRDLEVELGGRLFTLSPLTLGDWKAFRAHMRGQRIQSALAGGGEYLDSEDRRKIVVELASATISQIEQAHEFVTPEGLIYMLWRGIRKKHPDTTLEEIEELTAEDDLDKLAALQEGLNSDPDAPKENEADPTEAGTPSGGTTVSASSTGTTASAKPTSSD